VNNFIAKAAVSLSCIAALSWAPALAQSSAAGAIGQYKREQAERAQRAAAAAAYARAQAARQAAEQRAAARSAAERRQWEVNERKAAAAQRAKIAQEALEERRSAEREEKKRRCEAAVGRSDWVLAAPQCKTASAFDDPEAQYYLAKMMRDGLGTAQDPSGAVLLFKKSASSKFPPALIELCKMIHDGNGVPKNLVAAARCYAQLDADDYQSNFQIAGEGDRDVRQEAKELLIAMYFDGEATPPRPANRASVEATSEFRANLARRVDMLSPRDRYLNYFSLGRMISAASLKFKAKLWIDGRNIQFCRATSPKNDPDYEKRICDAIKDQVGSSLLIETATNGDGIFVGDLVTISM